MKTREDVLMGMAADAVISRAREISKGWDEPDSRERVAAYVEFVGAELGVPFGEALERTFAFALGEFGAVYDVKLAREIETWAA